MDFDDFQLFGEDAEGRPGNFAEIMAMIQHHVNEHDMSIQEALNILIDLIRPGTGPNSHDVKPQFTGALYAFGFGYLANKFEALFVNEMPWGIGFTISVEEGLQFNHLSKVEQAAVVRSLCVVLQTGGMNARVNDDNQIIMTGPEGDESMMDVDAIVSQFVEQMDQELGPDGPEPDDPMRRWMP